MTASRSSFPPTLESIIDEFEHYEDWDERYEFLVELGREIPALPDAVKVPEKGCMSTVWMSAERRSDGTLSIHADSDSLIIKGLLVVLLAAYEGRNSEEVLAFDAYALFERLGLRQHLSANRRNGLQAMIARVRQLAVESLS